MAVFLDDDALMAIEPDQRALYDAHAALEGDYNRGMAELEVLANRGSVMAMLYIADEWKKKGVEYHPLAETWYTRAYEKRSAHALLNLGLAYWHQNKYEDAERIWKVGVAQNDPPSCYWLGNLYLSPQFANKRKEKAVELLEKASNLRQIRAKNDLARLLLRERKNFKNIVKIMKLYLSVLTEGFPIARRNPHDRRLWSV